MRFFVVFALVAVACALPIELGKWELTDSGWQWIPLNNATTAMNATVNPTTMASNSTTIFGNDFTSMTLNATTPDITTTVASTTPIIIGNGLDFTTVPTTIAMIAGMTTQMMANASAATTTMASTSTMKIGNDLDSVNATFNATSPMTTPIASTTTVQLGNNLDSAMMQPAMTMQPAMFNATVNATMMASTSIGNEVNGMKTTFMMNDTSPTTIKFGNELDSATTMQPAMSSTTFMASSNGMTSPTFNATAMNATTFNATMMPSMFNATAFNATMMPSMFNATTMASAATIKFGNNLDGVMMAKKVEMFNASTSNVTIMASASTIKSNMFNATTTMMPSSTIKFGAIMDNATLAMFNRTSLNITAVPSNATIKLGNEMDGGDSRVILNATVLNTTTIVLTPAVKLGHDFHGAASQPDMNATIATIQFIRNATMNLGNNMDSSILRIKATTTVASASAIKFEDRRGATTLKNTEETTTAAAHKELKPNTCAISEHPSDHADCRRRADGDFFRNAKDCRMYFRCTHGLRMQCACPLGTVFSELTSVCDYEWAVPECNVDPQAWQPTPETSTETVAPSTDAVETPMETESTDYETPTPTEIDETPAM